MFWGMDRSKVSSMYHVTIGLFQKRSKKVDQSSVVDITSTEFAI